MKKSQKVVLIDYDGPLAKERKLDERTVQRIKKLIEEGFRVAIITGRSHEGIKQLAKILEKMDAAEKVSIFCEYGATEYKYYKKEWGVWLTRKGAEFRGTRKRHVEERLRKLAKEYGFEEALTFNIVTTYVSGKKAEELGIPFERIEDAIKKEVEKINREKKTGLKIIKTRVGLDIVPETIDKGSAAEKFLNRFRKPCIGFAFGDMFTDRKMAYGSKIKFIPVQSPEEFLKATQNLSQRLRQRQKRLTMLRRKRRISNIKRKMKGFMRRVK